jgi:hypothetical protein
MRYWAAALVGISLPGLCLADKPAPNAEQCAALEKALSTAGTQSGKASIIRMIEEVALGRTDSINPEAETEAGLAPGTVHQQVFADPGVRACALRTIGRSDLPEAVDFLGRLRPEDVGPDQTQMVWPAAQVALREAKLRRIADAGARTEFLEHTVTERHDAVSNGAVTWWAVDELCNSGSQPSLPVLQESIRRTYSGQRGEDEVEFCEARIRVVLRNSDRVKALGSVLNVAGDTTNTRLIWWAVNQLGSMRSVGADAELDRFARELEGLPPGSPEKASLRAYQQWILALESRRPR